MGFLGGTSGTEPVCWHKRQGFNPWVGKIPGGGHATQSSTLAWRIPWTEEPGGLQFIGSQRVGHDLGTEHPCTIYIAQGTVFSTCNTLLWKIIWKFIYMASQMALVVKNPPANAEDMRDAGSIPGLGRSLEEGMQPTPVFLPGESHGQRSLAGYSPWGCKESDTTEVT